MNKGIEGKKPFPWHCCNCRKQAVYGANVDYTTTMHHEWREYTIKIDGLKTPKCTNCGQVMVDAEALGELDAEFRRQIGLLASEQICACRVQAILTQHELAAALGVHDLTVAGWEDGRAAASKGNPDHPASRHVADPRHGAPAAHSCTANPSEPDVCLQRLTNCKP